MTIVLSDISTEGLAYVVRGGAKHRLKLLERNIHGQIVDRAIQMSSHVCICIVLVQEERNEVFTFDCRLVVIKLAQRHVSILVVRSIT